MASSLRYSPQSEAILTTVYGNDDRGEAAEVKNDMMIALPFRQATCHLLLCIFQILL